MAQGIKTGGRDIVKGQALPGAGRPPTPPDIKSARKLNRAEFEAVANRYLLMSLNDLKSCMANHDLPVLDLAICSLLVKVVSLGDQKRLGFLLDRLLGKVSANDTPAEEITVSLKYNIGDKPKMGVQREDD